MAPPTLKAFSLVLHQSIYSNLRQYRRCDSQFCDCDGGASSLNAAASQAVNEQHALWHAQKCKTYEHFRQILMLANQVVVFILLTMRTYALIGMRRSRLTRILDMRSKRPNGFNVQWSLVGQHDTVLSGVNGCHVEMTKSTGVHVAVAWEAQVGFDLLIFGLTIAKSTVSRRQRQAINSWIRVETGLIDLIHRDGELLPTHTLLLTCSDRWGIHSGILGHTGAIYFAFMVLANLSNIFTFFFAPDGLRGVLSTFASCVSVTMMSHLMLNLHEAASSTHTSHDTSHSSEVTVAFTTGIDPSSGQTWLDGSSPLSSRTSQPARLHSSQGTTGRSSLSSSTALSLFTNQAGSASAGRKTGGTLRSELQEIDVTTV
ncbi:hypothetical protein EW146_g7278 [Bondarzewia mesenterica]|uniref:Uncharacterized protein n=1 Tax=Bondarzewia mesenterica TaxID=1095465 RepID=A0A4S4LRW1_9AGAM|nr:hypothetical protein EW146_g7278 [Bondarzewia mesenterica]